MLCRFVRLIAVLLLTIACLKSSAAPPVTITPGLKVNSQTRLKPGDYQLTGNDEGVLQIGGSGFEVECAGAKIIGPGKGLGAGIHITGARNVTVRNANVTGCRWGIVLDHCVGVKLINCRTSYNNDLKPGTVIDESGREPEDQWGGGVLMRDCEHCSAQRCISQYQWDGIDVIRSAGCIIEDGDYSYNGNWGIHLWNSSHNTFRRNRAVWCTTGGGKLYQALTGWQTYDSQAVGIDHNSNDNLIEDNDLRFGGDAIFIRANEGPVTPGTVVPPRNASNRNILRGNDCSFSPNNAIEVDLVDDTVIENNNCSNSNYGLWLGYSRRCIVRGNTCINDSTHAVEIENGQDDLFELNVFGWDKPRPSGSLVYLRQNGREKTPSTGYVIRGNDFYGAGVGVLVRDTGAKLEGNDFEVPAEWRGRATGKLVKEETSSRFTESATTVHTASDTVDPGRPGVHVRPGSEIQAAESGGLIGGAAYAAELDGIPLWVRQAGKSPGLSGKPALRLAIPDDFWDRPAKSGPLSMRVRINHAWKWSSRPTIDWPKSRPRIDGVTPNPAMIGNTILISGANLGSGQLLLNGKQTPIMLKDARGDLPPLGDDRFEFSLPQGILIPTHYNLLWVRGDGEKRDQSWPITFGVDIPAAQMPHLLSATFEPKTLKVGELLRVTMTLRNNLPTTAYLTERARPPFTYEEKQASYEMGLSEEEGKLHLRVTSNFTSPHDPGSWPYLFGFPKGTLAPGETIIVTGYIKMEHPGEHEFRVGLVAGGFRFIDDNAFRTKVTVTP